MLKEKVTQCEVLVTSGIRRMSSEHENTTYQKQFFSRKVAEQDDHKISSYITT